MPRVPTYDTPQVTPQNLPGVRVESAATGALLAPNAQQTQQLGQALVSTGGEAARIVADQQMIRNEVRVDDGLNKLRQAAQALTYDPANGYLSKKGAAAIATDDNGLDLPASYGQKLQDVASQVSSSLENDVQRRLFAMRANDIQTGFHGDALNHMRQEQFNHALSTEDGAFKLAVDDAKLSWNDPAKVTEAMNNAKAAIWKLGQLRGTAANETEAQIRQAGSAVHLGVIESAIANNNATYAMQYLASNKGGMTADDILKAQGQVNHQMDSLMAIGAVNNAITAYSSRFAPSEFDRLAGVVASIESGGKDLNADGLPVTSAKGAKYAMQVMPATAANPGFGIAPAQADTPAEYNRIGKQYLSALVQKYGDIGQTLAAYNAGPAAADAAIAKAKAAGNPTAWASFLPKATQAYVQNGTSRYLSGAGAPQMPTKAEFVSAAVAQLGDSPRPEALKATMEQAERQYALLDQSRKERGQQALQTAQQALIANGGDFNALPAQTKSDLSRYDPDAYDNAMKFAKAIGRGDQATNIEAYAAAVTYPDELTKMTDVQFLQFLKTNFSASDQEKVAKLRADQLNGTSDDGAGAINNRAFNTAVSERLANIGINPTPKHGDTSALQHVGAIQKFLRDDIYDLQQQLGRKLTPQELEARIDSQFARNITFRRTVLGFDAGRTQQNMMSMTASDIPSDTLAAINAAFAKRGIANPTDWDRVRAYWNWKNKNG